MRFPTYKDYDIFSIPKSSGGYRCIEAPNPKLKEKQREHLKKVLYKLLPYSPFCHSYIKGRNVVTNALPHLGRRYILKLDIKDFFPSITWNKFYEKLCVVFHSHRSTRRLPDYEFKNLVEDCKMHFMLDKDGVARLPQGGPASPCLSNFYLSLFDFSVGYYYCKNISTEYNHVYYTRYSDDLVFSSNLLYPLFQAKRKARELLTQYYGLEINKKKVRIIENTRYQIVCGIMVNGPKLQLAPRYQKKVDKILEKVKKGEDLTDHDMGLLAYYTVVEKQDQYQPITWYAYEQRIKIKRLLEGV